MMWFGLQCDFFANFVLALRCETNCQHECLLQFFFLSGYVKDNSFKMSPDTIAKLKDTSWELSNFIQKLWVQYGREFLKLINFCKESWKFIWIFSIELATKEYRFTLSYDFYSIFLCVTLWGQPIDWQRWNYWFTSLYVNITKIIDPRKYNRPEKKG